MYIRRRLTRTPPRPEPPPPTLTYSPSSKYSSCTSTNCVALSARCLSQVRPCCDTHWLEHEPLGRRRTIICDSRASERWKVLTGRAQRPSECFTTMCLPARALLVSGGDSSVSRSNLIVDRMHSNIAVRSDIGKRSACAMARLGRRSAARISVS